MKLGCTFPFCLGLIKLSTTPGLVANDLLLGLPSSSSTNALRAGTGGGTRGGVPASDVARLKNPAFGADPVTMLLDGGLF